MYQQDTTIRTFFIFTLFFYFDIGIYARATLAARGPATCIGLPHALAELPLLDRLVPDTLHCDYFRTKNYWFYWDGPCLELIVTSSNFHSLLLLQDKLLESVWKQLIPVKMSKKLLDQPFSELIQ